MRGKLKIIQRLPSSFNGNPRYLLSIGDTVCRTAPDSPLAYSVTNYDGKMVSAEIGNYYGHPTLKGIK